MQKKTKQYRLLALFLFAGILFIFLLCKIYTSKPAYAVKREFHHLKKLDDHTISRYISYEDLYEDSSTENEKLSDGIVETFSLFFKYFDYSIGTTKIVNDSYAFVNVDLTTLDAKEVAKEYYRQIALFSMTNDMEALNKTPKDSTQLYFSILRDVLKNKKFDTVKTPIVVKLVRKHNTWKLAPDSLLEDELVGGFRTYTNGQNLFTPEEALDNLLTNIGILTPAQLVTYLGVDDIFSTGGADAKEVDLAVAEQIGKHLQYEILSSFESGKDAEVSVNITSLNLESVLSRYADRLIVYAATSEAISASSDDRNHTMNQLLIQTLQENEETATRTIEVRMKDDGTTWAITIDGEFTDALAGGLSDAAKSFNALLGSK